jgi:short subunit dehydrogenase-like uncharacterized protein
MWMIYGANGYTGELIARACAADMKPVLAGRDANSIDALAKELRCESRVFDARNPQLDGITLLLNCAGPFIHTSGPLVRACLDARVHYLDITGEIAVFERVMSLDGEAERSGVTLLPGVGFDVVPTDCLAAMLKEKLRDADDLILAFSGGAGVSRGTALTMFEGAGQGGAIRRDGKIVRVPMLHDVREIPFPSKPRLAMTIPWGDVSTAYYTTGIRNIRVYRSTTKRGVKKLHRMSRLMFLTKVPLLRTFLRRLVAGRKGPSAEARAKARMEIWGCVSNRSGQQVTMAMRTPDGYSLTVLTALAAVRRVLGEPGRGGAFTPAKRFGASFITTIEGVEMLT